MRGYGQYCPISRAAEVLAERWTPLVVRNLLLGCTTFNAIAGGVPGMSRTLLSQRLQKLEDAGVIRSVPKPRGQGATYTLTDSGHELWAVMTAMSDWAERWLERRPEHTDPSFVLWAWCQVHLEREALPPRQVTVRFDFLDEKPPHRRFWILFGPGGAELCYSHPGFDEDVVVEARSAAFTRWHLGELSWQQAIRCGDIRVEGPRALRLALPTWNARAKSRS